MSSLIYWSVVQTTNAINQFFVNLGDWFVEHGLQIILITIGAVITRKIIMIIVTRLVHHSIESSARTEKRRDRKLRADTMIGIFDSVFKVLIWITFISLVAIELGLRKYIPGVLASAAALSLLIGFGIQAFVKDLVSGFFVVAENQYRVGDVVLLATTVGGEVQGMVTRITLRTTTLRDHDGAIHFIPNGNISRSANLTLDFAKINIELTVPKSCDFEAIEKTINAIGIEMQKQEKWRRKIIDPPHYHGVRELQKEDAIIEVRAKTVPAAQWQISSELRGRFATMLHQHKDFATNRRKTS